MTFRTLKPLRLAAIASITAAAFVAAPANAWEPSKTVEFIVPAGTGGTKWHASSMASSRNTS